MSDYDPRDDMAIPPAGIDQAKAPADAQAGVSMQRALPARALEAAYAAGFDGVVEAPRMVPGLTEYPAEVILAVNTVMKLVRNVEKDGENLFHKYRYTSIGGLLMTIEPAMAEAGLVIFQNEVRRVFLADNTVLAISYDFILAHVSGKVWPIASVMTGIAGSRQRNGTFDEKVGNKCHTGARKYFLLGLFQTATGDTPDADADAGQQGQQGQQGQHSRAVAHEPRSLPPQRQQEVEPAVLAAKEPYRAIVMQARKAQTPPDGIALMGQWMQVDAVIDPLRTHVSSWNVLLTEMVSAFRRCSGPMVGEAWAAALTATSKADMQALNTRWDEEWSDEIETLAEVSPELLANLRLHLSHQYTRVGGDD